MYWREDWASLLLVLGVSFVLGVNAVLLHRHNRKAHGRLVRPLLRIVTGRPRARSLSYHQHPPAPPPPPPPPTTACCQPAAAAATESMSRAAAPCGGVWEAAELWVRWDPNPRTRETVRGWIESGDEDSARRCARCFCEKMEV